MARPITLFPVPVVGLTGGIGSGKSQAGEFFEQQGVRVVDADVCARIVVEPGTEALDTIVQRYGAELLLGDGSLDRRALREKVFGAGDGSDRLWLENLLHPLIGREIERQLGESPPPYAMLMSPLLLETEQKALCDKVLVVDLPEALQAERAAERDRVTRQQIEAIMKAQMGREARRQSADHLIDNSTSLQDLRRTVAALHEELSRWAQTAGGAR